MMAPRETVPPCCPAGPESTAAFSLETWHQTVDVQRWGRILKRRERTMREFRSAGDPRAADAVGWLSVACIVSSFPARLVGNALAARDPVSLVAEIATASTPSGPVVSELRDYTPETYLAAGGVEVIDAGSRFGWAIADLAGDAAGGNVVVLAGHPMAPTSFRTLLRERVLTALAKYEVAS